MTENKFRALLEEFRSRRIGVLGDFMLDEYIIGNSSRVSREAPIVVIDYIESLYHPGGASNAAQNIASFGASASAHGVVGDDREGQALRGLLEKRGVDMAGVVVDPDADTSLKLRIMAGELNAQKQQVARVDRNHKIRMRSGLLAEMRERLLTAVQECDAFLISDYGMGLVPGELSKTVTDAARERGIPVVVDSRFKLDEFAGATVATPNEVEALELLHLRDESMLSDPKTLASLVERTGIERFIVTRGSKGMLVYEGGEASQSIGIVGSNEATDVTGAGDTVSATIALALACGSSLLQAAQMATYAAAVVVMKRGTATASPDELHRLIDAIPMDRN